MRTLEDVYFAVEQEIYAKYAIIPATIKEKRKTKEISLARNVLFYVLHEKYQISCPKIAKRYERDERSVKAQLAKTRFQFGYDKELQRDIKEICLGVDKRLR